MKTLTLEQIQEVLFKNPKFGLQYQLSIPNCDEYLDCSIQDCRACLMAELDKKATNDHP